VLADEASALRQGFQRSVDQDSRIGKLAAAFGREGEEGVGRLVPVPKTEKKEWKMCMQRFHESENLHNVFEDIELLYEKDWSIEPKRSRILDTYANTIAELKIWERYLTENPFVAGDKFSLADCALYPNLSYLIHRGVDLKRERLAALMVYHDRVKEMNCAVEAMPVGYEKVAKTNLGRRIYGMVDEG